ncbi:cupin domain-containing protein [Mycolicibacterium baixiangningiae]|uniref:cupin domain-containing protein n=1 Tax=Mycolicibacterium baixiangningiae TaxID=2761578 RepID=UPI00186924F2|nr:cupin domain-containing protein [Mycolicibacterium baixiangningiae]
MDVNVGPSTAVSATSVLGRLIAPVEDHRFFVKHWEREPLLVQRHDPPYFDDLVTLTDVDTILAGSVRPPHLRVLHQGSEVTPGADRYLDPEAVYAHFRDGCTISLQFLHERIPPLGNLCRALSRQLSAACQINAYLTPPGEQGLATHYDTHDVFALQICGSKRWRIYDQPVRHPLEGQTDCCSGEGRSEPTMEFDLTAGDVLYLPRGFAHDAAATDLTSLHLTIGVRPLTWAHTMLSAMESVIERNPRYRRSLPTGFASDTDIQHTAASTLAEMLELALAEIGPEEVIADAAAAARSRAIPALQGHLLDLNAMPNLQHTSRIQRRVDVPMAVGRAADGRAELTSPGKTLRMPSHLADDLHFIVKAGEFTAHDLPGTLDDSGRLTLVKRLVREGLLTCRDLPAGTRRSSSSAAEE